MERLPTPVFWPGESHGLYSPWGHKESDTTEQLSHSLTHTHSLIHQEDINLFKVYVVVIQSPSHVWLFATPLTAAGQASLSLTAFQSLPKFMSMESVMPSNHLILCRPFSALNLSQHQGLSLHQVAKVLELQLQHQSFQWTLRTDLL